LSFEQPRRGLRALRYACWALRSWTVLTWYRCLYADLRIGCGVRLGRGVYINVVKGGSLHIGDKVHIDSHAYLIAEGHMAIGAHSYVGVGATIVAFEDIRIGANALIAAYATIRDQDHRLDRLTSPFREQGLVSSPVHIGDNVWIGTKATILRGVHIGDDAVIGANSVVTSPVAAASVAVGAPARVVRHLQRERA
jgi:acetyltransferase-like isoleucine patch superfamily enzyme